MSKTLIASLVAGTVIALSGCATSSSTSAGAPASTPAPAPAAAPAPATPVDSSTAESETAAALEKKFRDAARGYKVVEKDGKTMYCKSEKTIGTTLPRLVCMTEAQLRNQVETMDEVRNKMRSGAKCTLGPGCSGS